MPLKSFKVTDFMQRLKSWGTIQQRTKVHQLHFNGMVPSRALPSKYHVVHLVDFFKAGHLFKKKKEAISASLIFGCSILGFNSLVWTLSLRKSDTEEATVLEMEVSVVRRVDNDFRRTDQNCAPFDQRTDNSVHWIRYYPEQKSLYSTVTNPPDKIIRALNNLGMSALPTLLSGGFRCPLPEQPKRAHLSHECHSVKSNSTLLLMPSKSNQNRFYSSLHSSLEVLRLLLWLC